MRDYDTYWQKRLGELAASGRRRCLRVLDRRSALRVRVEKGRELLDVSSNDYLGLSHHPALIARASEYSLAWGVGAASSRLVGGNLPPAERVEAALATFKGMEAALLFASGVQANLTILPALLDQKTLGAEPLVYADRLNHASLIQGCIAAGVRQIRFRHNDLAHLCELLERDRERSQPRFIISETVFSMDGDSPDLPTLTALAARYGAFLYLDEAHATGVLGPGGAGLAHGLRNALVMGTFSKGLGGFGAYATCSDPLRDYLINRCGGVIYSTALPPSVLGAMEAALELIPTLEAERTHVQQLATRFRERLIAAGLDIGRSTTQIVPLIVGHERRALALAAALEEAGFFAVPIRPPTVPAGTSRIRFAFSACHRSEDMERLADSVIRLML